MRLPSLNTLYTTILSGFVEILVDFTKDLFKKKDIQLCPYPEAVRTFTNQNNTKLSEVSAINFNKFVKGNEDITIFNYYGKKAFDAYRENPQSIIKRENFVQFFKDIYYGKAIFVFSVKWFFIAMYRFYQIFINIEYTCIDTKIKNNELIYWNCKNEKCKVIEYIYPKYLRIIYVLIFDLFSFIFGVLFLKNLQKIEWNNKIVYTIQIIEYAFLITLFSLSFLNVNKCINSQTDKYLFFKYFNINDFIFIILDLVENYIK
jgi:hypothetical protein